MTDGGKRPVEDGAVLIRFSHVHRRHSNLVIYLQMYRKHANISLTKYNSLLLSSGFFLDGSCPIGGYH